MENRRLNLHQLLNGSERCCASGEMTRPIASTIISWGRFVRSKRVIMAASVLIFAFYKGTLNYLSKRLSADGFANLVLHGDVAVNERPGVIDRFRDDPAVPILLSSRIGGEGLDFQFCNTMFNYDLPWNPMEVEQRIGRLDRIGQEFEVIRIYNFSVEGTIEQKILDRLYNRIEIFQQSVGDLEEILGDIVHNLERELLSANLTPQEIERRVDSAALVLQERRRELQRLEAEAAQLVGVDEYFEAEVENGSVIDVAM